MEAAYEKNQKSMSSKWFLVANVAPKLIACSAILGVYIGTTLVLGHQLDSRSVVSWNLLTLCKVVAVSIAAFVASFLAFGFAVFKGRACKSYLVEPTIKLKLLTVFVLAIPQMVMWFVVFPGIYGYDAAYCLQCYLGEVGPVTTQYSIIFIVLLGISAQVGGGAVASIAIAVFIQSVISLFALYRLSMLVLERTCSRVFYAVSLLFSALFPFALLLRVSTSQDVLFGAFFLLVVVELIKLGECVQAQRKIKVIQIVPFVVCAVLMMLARNNGLHAFLVMIVISGFFIARKKAWRIAASFVVVFVLYFLISGPVYALFGIQGSSVTVREMSSIPSQQLTRALEEHSECFTDEEKLVYISSYDTQAFNYAAKDTSWYWSQCEIADVAKARLNQEYVKANLLSYIATYVEIGFKCPDSYANAFLMNTLGFWYPLKTYPDQRMYHPYIEYTNNVYSISQFNWNGDLSSTDDNSLLPNLEGGFNDHMASAKWADVPALSILFKAGFVFLAFVFLLLVAFLLRRSEMLFAFAFCAGFVITLLLAPVCLFRYVYPLTLCLPALALVLCGTSETRSLLCRRQKQRGLPE